MPMFFTVNFALKLDLGYCLAVFTPIKVFICGPTLVATCSLIAAENNYFVRIDINRDACIHTIS